MYSNDLMLVKTCISIMLFVMFSSANGLKQTYFKVTTNRGFQNMSAGFKTVKPTSLLKCSAFCAQNNECRAALFNASDQSCSFYKICKVDLVPKTRSDVIQNCPSDCSELPSGVTNGIYPIYPMINGLPYRTEVFCDMDGGSWTVIQRRTSLSSVDFARSFNEYKNGFGDKLSDHWLGNELLHHMLSRRKYKLRIEMEDLAGNVAFAEYDSFFVGNEINDFILSISGYSGTAGDSMTNPYCHTIHPNNYHVLNGVKFSAVDRDNDNCPCECASNSGWWMNWCACGNPNNLCWRIWNTPYDLKSAEMKIRI